MKHWVTGVAAATLLGLAGCEQGASTAVREVDDKAFQRARQLEKRGDSEEALSTFLQVIDNRPEAPESHLNAGLLFLEYKEEPIMAIYHFTKFLELSPGSEQAELVRQRIEAARRLFIRSLPGQPYENEFERLDLLEVVKQLQAENVRLKKELLAAEGKLERLGAAASTPPSSAAGAGSVASAGPGTLTGPPGGSTRPATYVVRGGDTLHGIARRFYGTTNRAMDIYRANQDVLPAPNSLKPGQTLRLP